MARTTRPRLPAPWPETWRAHLAPLAADVERVAGRLRGLTEARLRRPLAEYGTVADAGRALAQTLADAAAAAEATGGAGVPRRRTLPEVAVTAVGDQVAVTGHDLLRALSALPPDAELPTADGPRRATDVAAAAHDLTRAVKLAVD